MALTLESVIEKIMAEEVHPMVWTQVDRLVRKHYSWLIPKDSHEAIRKQLNSMYLARKLYRNLIDKRVIPASYITDNTQFMYRIKVPD